MAQLKSLKDVKHKVVLLFYKDEEQLKDLGEDLNLCLEADVDFAICDNMEDAYQSMKNMDFLLLLRDED